MPRRQGVWMRRSRTLLFRGAGLGLFLFLLSSSAFALFTPTITQSGGPSGTVFPGTGFTMTATVSSAGPTPTGNVLFQFTDGGGSGIQNLCQPNLSNGSGACSFSAPGNGSYRVRVIYSGDTFTNGAFQDFPFN